MFQLKTGVIPRNLAYKELDQMLPISNIASKPVPITNRGLTTLGLATFPKLFRLSTFNLISKMKLEPSFFL